MLNFAWCVLAEPSETLVGSDLKVAQFVRPPPPTLLPSGGGTSATKDTYVAEFYRLGAENN